MACTTALAHVYARMMGSLTDDQIRRRPEYIDEAKAHVSSKNIINSSNITSCPIPPDNAAPGSNAHIVSSARSTCNPNLRHYGISCAKSKHPKLVMCAYEGCLFPCFCVAPGGQKVRNILQKTPRPHSKRPAPGRLSTPAKA